jgi:hypothetical protein
MSVEMDDLYAQIREAMKESTKAADAWYEETYRTGVITDQSETALEFTARYNEYKALLREAELFHQTT